MQVLFGGPWRHIILSKNKFCEKKYGNLKITQPHLINHIIAELGLYRIIRINPNLEASNGILHQYIKSAAFYNSFNCCSVVGILNYLENFSRPNIEYSVH